MQRMVATARCGKETACWWCSISKKCIRIAKGGAQNDLWRKNTKIEKGSWTIARGTFLSVRSIQISNQQMGA